jgi:hypothetical protein
MRDVASGGVGKPEIIFFVSERDAKNASTAQNENNKIDLPFGRWK